MIRHAWSVLCERVVTDKDSNNVILSVLEQLNLRYSAAEEINPDQPVRLPISGTVASLWYKDSNDQVDDVVIRIRIRDFNGKYFGEGRGTVKFEGNEHARSMMAFNAIPVPQEGHGRYIFVVDFISSSGRWRKVAEIPLELHIARVPSDQVHSNPS